MQLICKWGGRLNGKALTNIRASRDKTVFRVVFPLTCACPKSKLQGAETWMSPLMDYSTAGSGVGRGHVWEHLAIGGVTRRGRGK